MESEEDEVSTAPPLKSVWQKRCDELMYTLTLGKHQTSLYFKG